MSRPVMWRPLLSCLVLWLTAPVPARAQSTPTCTDSLSRAAGFLQGNWAGRSLSISGRDTTEDALMTVHSRPLFGRYALQESWTAEKDGRR